ncbi:MAG: serine hydrolase [Candidatus Heimdallarchaeota archaeon]|nr:serine hydrolase [Candidatus Heimdallarchaeota archaeon]
MKNKSLYFYFMLIILFLSNSTTLTNSCASIERDYWPTNGWEKASFEEADLNKQTIDNMFEYIDSNNYDIDSVQIVKNGYLVVDEYLRFYTADSLHSVYSVTKSFVSTLIGIAIDEGYIDSINQNIMEFFVNVSVPNIELRENITIYHLLTMTSGIAWNEDISYYDPANTFTQMKASENWVEYVLSREMEAEPGLAFRYNSGASHLLSAIVEKAIGNTTLEYAIEQLFDPLGFEDWLWLQDPQGIYFGGADLQLKPRDMAKLGYLYLNNGTWNDTQIISEEYVHHASNATVTNTNFIDYGYQWWVYPTLDTYLAIGWAGQIILVLPGYDIVTVFTSSLPEGEWPFLHIAETYIIPAAIEGFVTPTTETTLSLVLTSTMFLVIGWIYRKKRN